MGPFPDPTTGQYISNMAASFHGNQIINVLTFFYLQVVILRLYHLFTVPLPADLTANTVERHIIAFVSLTTALDAEICVV